MNSPWIWDLLHLPPDFSRCRCTGPRHLRARVCIASAGVCGAGADHSTKGARWLRIDGMDQAPVWRRYCNMAQYSDVSILYLQCEVESGGLTLLPES